jgi:hypothetical protein
MIGKLGSGISITNQIVQQTEVKPATQPAPPPPTTQQKPFSGGTSLMGDLSVSGSLLQSQLSRQLTDAQSVNPPASQVMDNSALGTINPQPKEPSLGFEAANWQYRQGIETGSGNDQVDIQMGGDGMVHVTVNGQETWVGTPEQFRRKNIDTGGGNDTVTNTVDGALISTGEGNDTIHNKANDAYLDAGHGTNKVTSDGDFNQIIGGGGNDTVKSTGDHNVIQTNWGEDKIVSTGDGNSIDAGIGNDIVNSQGDLNQIRTGWGDDSIVSRGIGNEIYSGDGNDSISSQGDQNRINSGFGNDTVQSEGSGNTVNDPDATSLAGLSGLFQASQKQREEARSQIEDLMAGYNYTANNADEIAVDISNRKDLLPHLTVEERIQLVRGLFDGETGERQEDAAMEIMRTASNEDLKRVVDAIGWNELSSELDSQDMYELRDRLGVSQPSSLFGF